MQILNPIAIGEAHEPEQDVAELKEDLLRRIKELTVPDTGSLAFQALLLLYADLLVKHIKHHKRTEDGQILNEEQVTEDFLSGGLPAIVGLLSGYVFYSIKKNFPSS